MSADPAEQLHPALVHHIVNSLGWPRLRPLQEAAIEPLSTGDHALLIAPTAGGKTEAAFFPVLSRMLTEDWRGLTVIYLCPLRALLNNLNIRLDGYAQLVGRRVGLWHGDVGDADRRKLLADPPDILLTTPESLESMLVSTRVAHDRWFANVRTVVIDEAHSFGGDDRGWHMLAVVERISRLAGREIQRVALSATVGNPDELLAWLTPTCTGPRCVVQPPLEPGGDAAQIDLDYVGSLENAAVVISRMHRGEKRLVFVDSRARAEQLTALLRDRDVDTFVSHGSLGRDERRRAEEAFATGRDAVIVSTPTLELGIDVGDLDRVIQIDAPSTVASFLQRLGRTGRRPDSIRNTLFLATSEDALLNSAALLLEWSRGNVEPVVAPPFPAHLLAQQLLAIVLQEGGAGRKTWSEWLGTPCVLGAEVGALATEITDFLVDEQFLADDGGILGLGIATEAEYGYRHFMELLAAFTSPPLFTVFEGRKEIGQVSDQVLILEGPPRPILLAGRNWWIRSIDWNRRVVQVEPTTDPGIARWEGSGSMLHSGIARAIRTVLVGTDLPGVQLSTRAVERLNGLRAEQPWMREGATSVVRAADGRTRWWTFAGELANLWLTSPVDQFRQINKGIDSVKLSIDSGTPPEAVAELIRAADTNLLELRAGIAAQAVDGLKFADLLPPAIAREVLARRLDRRLDAMKTLSEPVVTVETL